MFDVAEKPKSPAHLLRDAVSAIDRQASAEVNHRANAAAERAAAEIRAEALAAPELDKPRADRDRLAERLTGYRADLAAAKAEAQKLAGEIRAAIVAEKDAEADKLEAKLAEAKQRAARLSVRIPEVEKLHAEQAARVEEAEARSVRLAARRKLPELERAVRAPEDRRRELVARFEEELRKAAEAEAVAYKIALGVESAATSLSTSIRNGVETFNDRYAAEAIEAGLAPLTDSLRHRV
jgi:hypothetical protein